MNRGYLSDSEWMTPAEARQYWLQRLYVDMTEVMARVVDAPVYSVIEPTHEWVNQALHEELVEANATIERLRKRSQGQVELLMLAKESIEDARPFLASLTTPPPPWKPFGFHANHDPVPDVVFWGEDGTGLPLWERPVVLHDRETLAQAIADKRRTETIVWRKNIGDPPVAADYRAADAVIEHFEKGME